MPVRFGVIGETPGLAAFSGNKPDVAVARISLLIILRNDVGDPLPIRGELGIAHTLDVEEVIVGDGPLFPYGSIWMFPCRRG